MASLSSDFNVLFAIECALMFLEFVRDEKVENSSNDLIFENARSSSSWAELAFVSFMYTRARSAFQASAAPWYNAYSEPFLLHR